MPEATWVLWYTVSSPASGIPPCLCCCCKCHWHVAWIVCVARGSPPVQGKRGSGWAAMIQVLSPTKKHGDTQAWRSCMGVWEAKPGWNLDPPDCWGMPYMKEFPVLAGPHHLTLLSLVRRFWFQLHWISVIGTWENEMPACIGAGRDYAFLCT